MELSACEGKAIIKLLKKSKRAHDIFCNADPDEEYQHLCIVHSEMLFDRSNKKLSEVIKKSDF